MGSYLEYEADVSNFVLSAVRGYRAMHPKFVTKFFFIFTGVLAL